MPDDTILFCFYNEQGLVADVCAARGSADSGPLADAAPCATIVANAWNIEVSISSKWHRLGTVSGDTAAATVAVRVSIWSSFH